MIQVMLAPNPRRNNAIDRVVVIGRSEDGTVLRLASVDGLAGAEDFKRQHFRYFKSAAQWKMAAILSLVTGIAVAIFWHWSAILVGLAGMIAANRKSQGNQAATLSRILQENPMAADQLELQGLVWEAPAKSVVPA